jgi:hypothetical protein
VAGVIPHDLRDFDDDQVFVIAFDGPPTALDGQIGDMKQAGHPVMTLRLADAYDPGASFSGGVRHRHCGALAEVNPRPAQRPGKSNTRRP